MYRNRASRGPRTMAAAAALVLVRSSGGPSLTYTVLYRLSTLLKYC